MKTLEEPMTRIAIAFERIATALEVKTDLNNDTSLRNAPSMKEVLKELLEHCEKQSSAASARAKSDTRCFGRESDRESFLKGASNAAKKWKRFAVAIRNVLENASS